MEKIIRKHVSELKKGDTIVVSGRKFDVYDAPSPSLLSNEYTFAVVNHGQIEAVRNLPYTTPVDIGICSSWDFLNGEVDVVVEVPEEPVDINDAAKIMSVLKKSNLNIVNETNAALDLVMRSSDSGGYDIIIRPASKRQTFAEKKVGDIVKFGDNHYEIVGLSDGYAKFARNIPKTGLVGDVAEIYKAINAFVDAFGEDVAEELLPLISGETTEDCYRVIFTVKDSTEIPE